MSGVVKNVKKAFKKVVKVVKKVAPYVAIAAAVYFTGGLALSSFAPTQAFAASLPGFGISSTGAATGIFSKAAAALGLEGGLVAGAGLDATIGVGAAAPAFANPLAAGAPVGIGAGTASGASGAIAAGSAAVAGGAKATMSLTDKLLLAKLGTDAIGAFLAPTAEEQAEAVAKARAKHYGSFYGMDGGGNAAAMPRVQVAEAPNVASPQAPQAPAAPKAPDILAEGHGKPADILPAPGQQQNAQMAAMPGLQPRLTDAEQQTLRQERDLFAPMEGVRYV